jgi:hypothetical protein
MTILKSYDDFTEEEKAEQIEAYAEYLAARRRRRLAETIEQGFTRHTLSAYEHKADAGITEEGLEEWESA